MVDSHRSKPNIDAEPKTWRRAKKHVIPIMNQLAVQLLPESEQDERKIILPDSLKSQGLMESQRFLVIAVGPLCTQIKEGNVVVGLTGVPRNQPPGIIHRGEQLAILVETQCLSVECDEDGNAVVFGETTSEKNVKIVKCLSMDSNTGLMCSLQSSHAGKHEQVLDGTLRQWNNGPKEAR